jgi:hypothetical protein
MFDSDIERGRQTKRTTKTPEAAVHNTRSDCRPAGGRTSEPTASCRLPFAGQKNAGLGLQDRDEVVRHEVHLVLTAFLGRELTLIAFV